MPQSRFRITWVLRNELALGPTPHNLRHLQRLEEEGVKAIVTLCDIDEHPQLNEVETMFVRKRVVLPDHKSGRAPTSQQLDEALEVLSQLRNHGPVFVHCVASMERSPLLCLAWLMRERGLSRLQALDYLTQVHPGTNPLPEQLALLNDGLQRRGPAI